MAEPDYGNDIDQATFEQILEMDDDESRDFSGPLFADFKLQARQTFYNMRVLADLPRDDPRDPWKNKDLTDDHQDDMSLDMKLDQLSRAGHFLKGSSATLGLTKVQKGCEKIQHYGARQDDAGDPSNEGANEQYKKIKNQILSVTEHYHNARERLDRFYGVEYDT